MPPYTLPLTSLMASASFLSSERRSFSWPSRNAGASTATERRRALIGNTVPPRYSGICRNTRRYYNTRVSLRLTLLLFEQRTLFHQQIHHKKEKMGVAGRLPKGGRGRPKSDVAPPQLPPQLLAIGFVITGRTYINTNEYRLEFVHVFNYLVRLCNRKTETIKVSTAMKNSHTGCSYRVYLLVAGVMPFFLMYSVSCWGTSANTALASTSGEACQGKEHDQLLNVILFESVPTKLT